MGKPTGFLEYEREESIEIAPKERIKNFNEFHIPLSQQEVRAILSDMAEQGLARVSRGRGGSQLTPKGRELWEKVKDDRL